jgi:DNA polymerase-3 subunit alpha
VADLDLQLDWAASRARDRISGQGNLFDLVAGSSSGTADPLETAPQAPTVADYDPTEKLRLEKELLGFYLSDHPLQQLAPTRRLLAPIGLASLEEQADRSRVSLLVMVPELRLVTTRKGDRMAVLQVEDLTGSAEAVVFPKTYARLSDHLAVDARLLLWAQVDRRDERVQLIVDDVALIDELQVVLVELESSQAGDVTVQHRLRDCLQRHRPADDQLGVRVPVVAEVMEADRRCLVRLGHQFCVADAAAAAASLTEARFRVRLHRCAAAGG